jgi:hypothetical protein
LLQLATELLGTHIAVAAAWQRACAGDRIGYAATTPPAAPAAQNTEETRR